MGAILFPLLNGMHRCLNSPTVDVCRFSIIYIAQNSRVRNQMCVVEPVDTTLLQLLLNSFIALVYD